MTDFNPLAGAILDSAQALQQVDLGKQRQVRRAQTLRKNVASPEDQFDHQVESAEELTPIHDEEQRHPDKGRNPSDHNPEDEADEPPQIDLTA